MCTSSCSFLENQLGAASAPTTSNAMSAPTAIEQMSHFVPGASFFAVLEPFSVSSSGSTSMLSSSSCPHTHLATTSLLSPLGLTMWSTQHARLTSTCENSSSFEHHRNELASARCTRWAYHSRETSLLPPYLVTAWKSFLHVFLPARRCTQLLSPE